MYTDGNLVFQKQTRMVIDPHAITNNVKVIRSMISPARLIAVVKENGYGMGLEREYNILKTCGIDFYAVTNSQEALALRAFGCKEDILLMSPSFESEEAQALIDHDIILMLGTLREAELLKDLSASSGVCPRVHLSIETGMGRYGFLWNDLPDLKELSSYINIEGCYSHLNGRPSDYEKMAKLQASRLREAAEGLKAQGIDPGMLHLCNSAGTMSFGAMGFDAVRCGSALLGKSARGGGKLKNAVWLEAPICQVVSLPKGSTIGYQACAVLSRDSRLGLIRAGHGDGIMLGYADNPEPLFKGILHLISVKLRKKRYQKTVTCIDSNGNRKKVPLVGRSGIAHIMIDLTGTDFKEGDTVRFEINPLFIHPSVEKVLLP